MSQCVSYLLQSYEIVKQELTQGYKLCADYCKRILYSFELYRSRMLYTIGIMGKLFTIDTGYPADCRHCGKGFRIPYNCGGVKIVFNVVIAFHKIVREYVTVIYTSLNVQTNGFGKILLKFL